MFHVKNLKKELWLIKVLSSCSLRQFSQFNCRLVVFLCSWKSDNGQWIGIVWGCMSWGKREIVLRKMGLTCMRFVLTRGWGVLWGSFHQKNPVGVLISFTKTISSHMLESFHISLAAVWSSVTWFPVVQLPKRSQASRIESHYMFWGHSVAFYNWMHPFKILLGKALKTGLIRRP